MNISANKTSLREVLNELLAPYMLNYIVSNNKIVIRKNPSNVAIMVPGSTDDNAMLPSPEEARNIDISGRVMSSTGEYLAGVTVQVKGGGAATKTDVNGFFRLSVPENSILVYTLIYKEEMPISGRTNYDIVLNLLNLRWKKWWWDMVLRKSKFNRSC